MSTKPAVKPTAKPAGKARAGNAVAEQQARIKGFALDLSHKDADDNGFKEYA